jgi:hypothetical protein
MTKIIFSAALLLAISATTAAYAETGDRTASNNDLICHVQYHEGAIINRQVCMTSAQWHFMEMQGRKNIRDLQFRSGYPTSPRP